MDEQVLAAIRKWPGVPDVHGWLRLDRRGHWYLIDRQAPGFDEALHGQGSRVTSQQIIDFIGRNYQADDAGRWFWQNGPQRVFVDLDLAPLVYRVVQNQDGSSQGLVTHTGYPVERIAAVELDREGNLFVATEHGPGVLHDLDLGALEIAIDEDGPGPAKGRVTIAGREFALHAGESLSTSFVRRPRPG